MIFMLLTVVFLTALSAAFAFALSRFAPKMRTAGRAALAAAAASAVPLAAGLGSGMLLPAPLVLLALYVGLFTIPAFPVALIVSRGLDSGQRPKRPGDAFD